MGNLINFSKMATSSEIQKFCFGGQATFTLESKETGQHYTFRILKREFGMNVYWFAYVLNNSNQYTYMGKLISRRTLQFTEKSKFTWDAPSVKALCWFLRALGAGVIPNSVIVYHSNKCGRCGRELSSPSSIRAGIGPECQRILG